MDNSVLNTSQSLLDDCVASEHANDLGFMDIPSPDDRLPSLGISLNDHQPAHTSHASIATGLPAGDVEDLWLQDTIHLDDIRTVAEFVRRLQEASLDDPSLGMSCKALERL